METIASLDVHIQADMAHDHGESLDIQWSVENKGSRDVIVLSHLFRAYDDEGRPSVEPNLVYVDCDLDGRVQLAKKVLPVPKRGIHVATPFVPLGSLLAGGKRVDGTLSFMVPLQSWDPYSELMRRHLGYGAVDIVKTKCLHLELAVLADDPRAILAWVDTEQGSLAYPNYDVALQSQVLLQSAALPWSGEAYR